jgi:hypothetical protein
MSRHIRSSLTSLLLIGTASICQAQYMTGQSGSGVAPYNSGSGMFGSRSVGSGTLSAGQRTLNGSQAGGQAAEDVGSLSGSERFLRGNRQGQFVGSDQRETSFVGSAGSAGATGRGISGFGSQNNMMRNFQQGRNQQFDRNRNRTANQGRNSRTVRASLTLGFAAPTTASPMANKRLTGILQRSSRIEAISPLAVQVRGRTAILTGQVASESDRELAQKVVLLEPGISQVQNDLTVAGEDLDSDLFPLPAAESDSSQVAPPDSESESSTAGFVDSAKSN